MAGRFFPVQTLHLGPSGTFAGFNEAIMPMIQSGFGQVANGQLGMIIEQDAKVYRLVQFDNGPHNVASAAGGAAYWYTRASNIITSDESSSEGDVNGVAGGFLRVVTDQYYCFVQIGGKQSVQESGAVVGYAALGSSTDLLLAAMAPNSTTWDGLEVGIFYSADAAGFATMYWLLGAML